MAPVHRLAVNGISGNERMVAEKIIMIMSLGQRNRFLNPASGGTFAPTASSWENNKTKIVISNPSVDG